MKVYFEETVGGEITLSDDFVDAILSDSRVCLGGVVHASDPTSLLYLIAYLQPAEEQTVMSNEVPYEQPHCWVLHKTHHPDGSGDAEILGVYTDKTRAEAAAWRCVEEEGMSSYIVNVTERVLND